MTLPLAVTMGEPAGIGLDVAVAAWIRREADRLHPFYILADPGAVRRRVAKLECRARIDAVAPSQAAEAFADALPIVDIGLAATAAPGRPDGSSGPAAIESIKRGVADVMAGRAAALVTSPVAKNVLYRSGFAEPGHTEFLARLAEQATGRPVQPVMMLWSPELAVIPVTIHLPLAAVPGRLSTDLIAATARIAARDLRRRFGIANPRIAVAALNPHAGEDGALGNEDDAIVRPAVERMAAEGIAAVGPLPADTMFHAAARARYDVALCMYHDQALIPIKTLAFDHAVNVTLGLPFVRTSPDHGTAFDIAGTGKADPSSFIAAVTLAARLAQRDAGAPGGTG